MSDEVSGRPCSFFVSKLLRMVPNKFSLSLSTHYFKKFPSKLKPNRGLFYLTFSLVFVNGILKSFTKSFVEFKYDVKKGKVKGEICIKSNRFLFFF